MIYFHQNTFTAKYFQPQYLHGAAVEEGGTKSGVNRLWAMQMQEEADKAIAERKEKIQEQVEKIVAPKVVKIKPKVVPKPREKVVEAPETAPSTPAKPFFLPPATDNVLPLLRRSLQLGSELQAAINEFNLQAREREVAFEAEYDYHARLLLLAA